MIFRIVIAPNAAKHSRYFHVTKNFSTVVYGTVLLQRKVTFPVIFEKDSIQLSVISQLL
jgi:hypothetical protein